MSDTFYITTPIYYVNDVPHVGHAYTTIAADAFARYHRARGQATYFLTGTDEHGQKIQEAAEKRGVTPIELADTVVQRFRETWVHLDIANDDFIRTTEDRHKKVVAEIWKRIEAAGDIELGAYEGWYCVGCESFYPDNQLLTEGDSKNLCPIHKTPAKRVAEPSYMFKMSAYADRLLAHIEANPDFIRPTTYRNEVVSFIKSGLRDLSVSRTSFDWGIPVPGSDDHIMFVWVDALSNYISALGPLDSEKTAQFFPEAVHLIGKDIIRFHAVYWPCLLMSAGLPLPKTILAHGWWTVRGEKISKSMPATRVDPNMLAEDIGADALRYFLLREVPLGLDGDFSYESLIGRYNSELANDLGNLLNRVTKMATNYYDGAMPAMQGELTETGPHAELADAAKKAVQEAASCFDDFAPSRALESIWALVRAGNTYLAACQPWKLAKDESRADEVGHILHTVAEVLTIAARMFAPVMPTKAIELLELLGFGDRAVEESGRWPAADELGRALEGISAFGPEPATGGLFPRIDRDREEALLDKWIPADARVEPVAPTPAKDTGGVAKPSVSKDLVSFDDFKRYEFRAARVIAAEPVPKTSKLLKVRLDVGELGERQVIAGVAEAYEPETLIGKTVILLANLEPATIRGVRSEGMILAAGGKSILGLSTLDRDVPPGTIVR